MKKTIKRDQSPNLMQIMKIFCEIKREIYGYDEETYQAKLKNFYNNIQSICFKDARLNDDKWKGGYDRKKGIVYLNNSLLNSDDKELILVLMHELNHAWNYEKGKRMGVIETPITLRKMKKYIGVMETINESESRAMFGEDMSEINIKGMDSNDLLKSVGFHTLCVLFNKPETELLKLFDGKTIEDIINDLASDSGHTPEETETYLEGFSKNISDIYMWLTTNNIKLILETKSNEKEINPLLVQMQELFNKQKEFIKKQDEIQDLVHDLKWKKDKTPEDEAEIQRLIDEHRKLVQDRKENVDNKIDELKAIIDQKRKECILPLIEKHITSYQAIYEQTRRFIETGHYSEEDKRRRLANLEVLQEIINEQASAGINTQLKTSLDGTEIVQHEGFDSKIVNLYALISEYIELSHSLIDIHFEYPWDCCKKEFLSVDGLPSFTTGFFDDSENSGGR